MQIYPINNSSNQNEPYSIKRNFNNQNLCEYYITTWLSKAKLNSEIKIFDAKAVFDEILQHPEANGFTNGCAIYFYDGVAEKALENQIKSNAIVLKKLEGKDKLEILFFEKGKLLCNEEGKAKR